MVAYKPKRAKYLGYKNPDFSPESIRNFIDDVLGGGGEYGKVNGDLNLTGANKEDL